MTTKKRTEIIIETERVIVITPPPGSIKAWCKACVNPVEWLSPEFAATLINVPPRLIYRWVESGQLHFIEKQDGSIMVCRNSLFGEIPSAEQYREP